MNGSSAGDEGPSRADVTVRMVDLYPETRGTASHNGAGGIDPALRLLIEDPVLGCGDGRLATVRKRAAWRQVVLSRARRARHELLTTQVADPSRASAGRWGEGAAEHILRAKEAALQRVTPWSWFEGSQQEQAWLSLHEAEAEIIQLLPPEELQACAETILHKARRAFCADDPRVRCIETLLEQMDTEPGVVETLRPRLFHLAQEAFEVLDDRFAQSRGYRNRLIRLTTMALGGIALGLVAGAMGRLNLNVDAGSIPPGWETLLLVVLFGAVGALVSAVPPVAKASGIRNPFSLPLFQLLLKLAMGPLFALVGVLILQTKLISELRPAEDLRTLVVWATVFGAAQQTVTRFIDQRVSGILGEAPSAAPGPQSKPHAPKREARST